MNQELYPSRRKRVMDLLGALERDQEHRSAILYELRHALDAYFAEREEILCHGVRAVLGARVEACGREHAQCHAAFARLVELRYEGFSGALDKLTRIFRELEEREIRHAA